MDKLLVPLAEVARLNPPLAAAPTELDEELDFFPMAVVDASKTTASTSERRPYADVRKGYTPFINGDLLLAKITPCFENGKIAQASVSTNFAFGSTEFHVIRPESSRLDPRYLVHFLRREQVRREGERQMTGSGGQRRVPRHFLESLPVPVIPIAQQRRIATILDLADTIRAKRREALAQLDRLAQAIFNEMFGERQSNPKGWTKVPIRSVASVSTGGTPSRRTQGYFGGDIPWVKTTELVGETIADTEEKLTDSGLRAIRGKLHPKGSVLVAMYGQGQTRGRCGMLEVPASCNQACGVIYPSNHLEPNFLFWQLRLAYQQIRALGRGGNQENLNLQLLSAFEILVPPLESQRQFVERSRVIESIRVTELAALKNADALFASLQHRAFQGSL